MGTPLLKKAPMGGENFGRQEYSEPYGFPDPIATSAHVMTKNPTPCNEQQQKLFYP